MIRLHQANNIEKDVDTINVPARTESQIDPDIISIAESSSPEQSNENPDQSPVELTLKSTGVQSDNTDQPSTQQSDVAGVNDESDKETKQGDNNSSISTEESCVQVENTTSDVELCDKFTTTVQEVDVVMLPSLMQPDVSKQAVKRCGEVQKQETGIKKKTRKQTRKPHECKECGKMLSSSSKYSNHMKHSL
ncbi:hypothetical protein OS493_024182 [Desmophyllum pertusum]|uniref:C2H2-type domain-containing protein n=1 Tax=Desmophyllum pertusum TaxID=174260 RepID=A0A9W9ZCQ8_9CNID|nr:hypothetical protein OS493_024182 [Desmophyllum pertusum]